jgi:hypothetical protein
MGPAALGDLSDFDRTGPAPIPRTRDARSSQTAPGTDCYEMEIAGLGLAMIAISILLLVWAFPKLPQR